VSLSSLLLFVSDAAADAPLQPMATNLNIQGVPEKIAQTLCTTILQLHVRESCGLQQNVQKEIFYTTKDSV